MHGQTVSSEDERDNSIWISLETEFLKAEAHGYSYTADRRTNNKPAAHRQAEYCCPDAVLSAEACLPRLRRQY